ncbi:MAG: radical SAM protein [Thermodesulfobacteriota bacterium]
MKKMEQRALQFEQGPIRPPSEAGSLLIRVTRNCPWNRCVFCSTYKGQKFSRRSLEEIKADVDAAKAIADRIREISWATGDGGAITRRVMANMYQDPQVNDCFGSIALWLAHGGETVFLQDANSLILSTDSLVEILGYIRGQFPHVKRITSYARALTLSQKSVEDFKRLKKAGLTRLHVGMESGSDTVLQMIQKGGSAAHIIDGGKKVVEAGISLCLYIIPGIGGRMLSRENALECARVVNAINPDFVRFRSLYVKRGSPLWQMTEDGNFDIPDEDEIVREIRLFIESLDGVTTTLVSDHILNLLQEVEGKLPEEKERLLGIIDAYLNLPDEDRLMFQLGRRGGAFITLAEFQRPGVKSRLTAAKQQIEQEVPGGIPEYIREMKRRYI